MATFGRAGALLLVVPPPPPPPQAVRARTASAPTTATRLGPMRNMSLSSLSPGRSAERVYRLRAPAQPHAVPAAELCSVRSAELGDAGDDEDRSGVQDDDVPHLCAGVHDVGHRAGRAALVGPGPPGIPLGQEPDPLGAETGRTLGAEEAPRDLAVHEVRRPDEVRDE